LCSCSGCGWWTRFSTENSFGEVEEQRTYTVIVRSASAAAASDKRTAKYFMVERIEDNKAKKKGESVKVRSSNATKKKGKSL